MKRRRFFCAAAVAALSLTAASCGGGGGGSATTAVPTTPPAATTGGAGTGGDAAAGATVFNDAGCGNCHTLSAAGSSSGIGPNLDDLKPDFESVVAQVTVGGSGMPSFKSQLSEQQIKDVAAYVVQSTQG